ncbi:ATP-binding cassette domain-containing protein [Spongisporangium articulatum]|uniref:ATP-binding cassette domain-containing protein n=1 Tax=Spongisporangium articulatum TaxID=3362603 RepID=A0ABW8AL50_9ACTN
MAGKSYGVGSLPIRKVVRAPDAPEPDGGWPASVAAVGQVLRDGLPLSPATVLVGENGSGKSTLIEGIALAYGLSREGGSTGARHSTRESESGLHRQLQLVRGALASKWGFFLRAETMHGFFTYLEENPGRRGDSPFHEMSHGESFLEVLQTRFTSPGLYVLDEPESALSFGGCLALIGVLHQLVASGTAQVLMATHSPVLAALPGARILQLDGHGLHETRWEELEIVEHHRAFLADPQRYLRHVT